MGRHSCAAQAFGVCIVGQLDVNDNVIRPVDGVHLSNRVVDRSFQVTRIGRPQVIS